MLKSPATLTPFPVLTHTAVSVKPAATLMTYRFSPAETMVIPGAGEPSHPVSVSYFPSMTGQVSVCADAGAAAIPKVRSSSATSARKRFN
jgi:hypothetical protein